MLLVIKIVRGEIIMIPIWFPEETYRLGVIIFRWKQLLVIHRPRNFSWWP